MTDQPPAEDTPPPPTDPDTTGEPAGEATIDGRLGGDPDLEGGCAWLEAPDGARYEVIYPDGYELRFDPVTLVDPDGEVVAQEGDTLQVRGELAEDMVSICQVGTIFRADAVERG